MHFFETQAALVAMKQARANHRFYQSILKLIQMHGREEEALTLFDLEDMIRAIPGIPSEYAVQVSELASNAGREYVSAHEVQRREQELTAKIFKAAYLGYLISTKKVSAEDLFPTPQSDSEPNSDDKD
jgi:hypothetical protein